MTTQYRINQLNKDLLFSDENYQNINNDFWIYKFEIDPKKVGYTYSLIDEVKQELASVKSVVYLKGKVFYALFDKSKFKSEFELEEQIKELISNSDEVLFRRISNPRNLEITYAKNQDLESKRYLAQLLFNSLANTSDTHNSQKSNITGSLYWVVKAIPFKETTDKKKGIWQYATLNVELDYHLHLKLEVKTFSNLKLTGKMNFPNRKTPLRDYVQYEILPDNIRSMRRLKTNEYNLKPETTYIIAQVEGKKNTVSFLDFSTYEKFTKSKSGVLYEFLKEANTHLCKYITLQYIELPLEEKTEFNKKLSETVKSRIQEFYRAKPIVLNIADSLKDDELAKKLAQDLFTFLTDKERSYQAVNVTIDELSKDAINIRIIRNKSYYDEGKDDEHFKDKAKEYLINHVTIDNFDFELERTKKGETKKNLSDPAIDVILKELYIKNDIMQSKITIMDWSFGEWIFMSKEELKNDEEKETSERKEKQNCYKVLKVSENGTLSFEVCAENQIFSNANYERYKAIYQQYDKFNGREFLNCLVVSEKQDINLVFDTPLFTIQDVESIGETLGLENQDTILLKSQITTLADNFLEQYSDFKSDEKFMKAYSAINNYKEKFNKDELNEIFENNGLTNRTKIKKLFCKFYFDNSLSILGKKDVLHHFFKSQEMLEELFSSKTNIYYSVNNEAEAFYFVGVVPDTIQTSFNNATNIRKVKAVGNLLGQSKKLFFDKLIETMNVDFVKQGNLTVLPFPFKYLREI